jgi:pimeloyl-ACP methyl ester carboxylesterase
MTKPRVLRFAVFAVVAVSAVTASGAERGVAADPWECGAYDQTGKRGRDPVPDASGRVYPVVTIHGITGSDDDFDKTIDKSVIGAKPKPPRSLLDALAGSKAGGKPPGLDHAHIYSFSYTPDSLRWVDHPGVGAAFAKTIDCLHSKFGTPVSIVAHSMGGLVARWVATSKDDSGLSRASKLGKVITLGTPYEGSWLSSVANGVTDVAGTASASVALLNYVCGEAGTSSGNDSCGPIPLYAAFRSEAGRNMRVGDGALGRLEKWPDGLDVTSIAGSITLPTGLFDAPVKAEVGDLVVGTKSATADPGPGRVFKCRYDAPATTIGAAFKRLLLISDPLERHRRLTNLLTGSPCYHSLLMRNVELTNEILGSLNDWIKARRSKVSPTEVPPISYDSGRVAAIDLHVAEGSGAVYRRFADVVAKLRSSPIFRAVADEYDAGGIAWDMRCDSGLGVFPRSANTVSLGGEEGDRSSDTYVTFFGDEATARDYFDEIVATLSSIGASTSCIYWNDWGFHYRFERQPVITKDPRRFTFSAPATITIPPPERSAVHEVAAHLQSNLVLVSSAEDPSAMIEEVLRLLRQ